MIEACLFDLDGTTIDGHGRLYDGLEEALQPQSRHFAITILTARGYTRFRQAVTENPALKVTSGMPVALENGARIMDSTSGDNLHYVPLSNDETDSVHGYIAGADKPFHYVSFQPEAPRSKSKVWVPDPKEAERLGTLYADNADVFTGSNETFFEVISAHRPCMITCKTREGAPQDIPQNVKYYTRGSNVNFMPMGADKGSAAAIIADLAGLNLRTTLAAGNDHNDLPMLELDGLGHPVAVGTDMTASTLSRLPEHSVYLADHRLLGGFVLEMAGRG